MKYVFTITQGRTGTMSLANLFMENDRPNRSEAILHEPLLHTEVGNAFPGMMPPVHFNTFPGFTDQLSHWWNRKGESINSIIDIVENKTEKPCDLYCETAHYLSFSGLVEAMVGSFQSSWPWRLDPQFDEIHLVLLHRPMLEVMASMHAREDYKDIASVWTWHLDPSYKYNLLQAELSDPVQWFYLEVETRKLLYEIWLNEKIEEHLPIYLHHFNTEEFHERDKCRELLEKIRGEEINRYCTLPEVSNQGKGTDETLKNLKPQEERIKYPFVSQEQERLDTRETLKKLARNWLEEGNWLQHKGRTDWTSQVERELMED